MPSKTPSLLSPEQRVQFGRVPPDLSDREIARYYTFSEADLAIIKQHRRPANRLGFATQLALLRRIRRPAALPVPRVQHAQVQLGNAVHHEVR